MKEEDKDVTLPVLKPVMVVWPQQMARRVFPREDQEVGPDVVVESEIFLQANWWWKMEGT